MMAREQIGNFHSNVKFTENNQIVLSMNWESVPNENSTITLDPTITDPVFGQPVAHLDWNLLETEKRTVVGDWRLPANISNGGAPNSRSPPPYAAVPKTGSFPRTRVISRVFGRAIIGAWALCACLPSPKRASSTRIARFIG